MSHKFGTGQMFHETSVFFSRNNAFTSVHRRDSSELLIQCLVLKCFIGNKTAPIREMQKYINSHAGDIIIRYHNMLYVI